MEDDSWKVAKSDYQTMGKLFSAMEIYLIARSILQTTKEHRDLEKTRALLESEAVENNAKRKSHL